nr:unnamed protein product [Callosobruchus analis]
MPSAYWQRNGAYSSDQ